MEDVPADLLDRLVVPVARAIGTAREHGDGVPAPQERVDQVGSDETGAAGDENFQLPSLFGAEEYPKRSLARATRPDGADLERRNWTFTF